MFSAFERMVAFRYLRARRQEGFVSVIAAFSLIGIALGVGTLIVVMSVMNGFREELLDRILGLNGHMMVYAEAAPFTDYDRVAGALGAIPGIVAAAPTIEGQVMATARAGASGALVRGLRGADLAKYPLLSASINAGSLDGFDAGEGVIVGDRLASRLGIGVGGQITLISPQGNPTVMGTVPRARSFTVAGTFNVGMYEYDSSFVYMPLELAQLYFKMPDAVTGIEVLTADPDQIDVYAEAARQAAGLGYRVVDWRRTNAHFFNALQVERNVMFVILTLIVLVAAFNIIAGLIMVVKDKGRDIAIMRTMGATRGQVMRIFFMNGAAIGIIGTLIGLGLGVAFAVHIDKIKNWLESLTGAELFAPEIRFLSQLPAKIEPGEVVAVVLMAIGLSLLATIYPSWRAARLDPVEALRYE
ncbi:MAG: lipoprotein-releasing ABC transporter permease subunit [Alphaproteobacteria bacterium]